MSVPLSWADDLLTDDRLFRDADLQEAIANYDAGKISVEEFRKAQDKAAEDSVKRFEAAGQPVVTDGEQRASS